MFKSSFRRLNICMAILALPVCAASTVSISPSTIALRPEARKFFSARLTNGGYASVNWSVVEQNGGKIASYGYYTAPKTPGIYTVRAALKSNANDFAEAKVTVVAPPVATLTVPSVIKPGDMNLKASVPAQVGAKYFWTLQGGTITSDPSTHAITFNVGEATTITLSCKVTNGMGDSVTSTQTLPVQAPIQLAIKPGAITRSVGSTMQFGYAGVPVDAQLEWKVLEAEGGQIDASGVYAAPQIPGVYTVQLDTVPTSGRPAQAKVTVVNLPVATLHTPEVIPANTSDLKASVPFQTGATYAWTLDGGQILSGENTDTLLFRSNASGNLVLSCKVTNAAGDSMTSTKTMPIVGSQPAEISVSVSPSNATVKSGQSLDLVATVIGAKNPAVTWGPAELVNAQGRFTAPNVAGPVTLTATSVEDPTKFAVATLNVVDPGQTAKVILNATPASGAVIAGGKLPIEALCPGSTQGVNWEFTGGYYSYMSGEKNRKITFVASDYDTKAPMAPGEVTIKATSIEFPEHSATLKAHIFPVGTRMGILPNNSLCLTGEKLSFSATLFDKQEQGVTWAASAGTINSSTGAFEAPATAQTVTISATSLDGTLQGSTELKVIEKTSLGKVTLSIETATVAKGGSLHITGSVQGSSQGVEWKATAGRWSYYPNMVDMTWTAPDVAGTYQITATSKEFPTQSAVVTVTVQ